MENSYGIGVQNRYGMFIDDEADPFDMKLLKKPAVAVPKSSEEKENKSKTKTAVKKTTKTEVNGKSDKTNGVAKGQTQSRNNDNRVKFQDREERNNRRNNQGPRDSNNGQVGQRFDGEERPRRRFEKKFDDDGSQRRFNSDGGAPRRYNDGERRFDGEGRGGRGRGMGRGGRGGRGARRDFDRHSGSERSGIKSVDKREGSGSYNWGSAKEQIDENQLSEQMQATDIDASTEDKEKTTGDENTSDNDSGVENAGPKEPEEPKEMTLDEYKAMQKASRVKPEFNVRKAGEGESDAQWKKTYILKKKIEESEEEESEEEEYEDTHQKKKVVLNIDFQFSDSPMRGGRGRGRGGRGGMGGRGRGEGRGGRGGPAAPRGGPSGYNRGGRKQEAPKMDDEGDFPSLSGRK